MLKHNYNILFIGDMNDYSKDRARVRILQEIGHRVESVTHTKVEETGLDYVEMSLWGRVMWKFGFHLDTLHVNEDILQKTPILKPDILWIQKGNMIYPGTLKKIRQQCPHVIIVSHSEDNMFKWGNRTWYYTLGLKYYDVVFTTKIFNCNANELPSVGAKKVIMVDKGFDPQRYYPIELTQADKELFHADVSFIGSYEKERAQSILYLAQHGIKVRIWGNGWDHFANIHRNCIVENRPIINLEQNLACTKAICASHINLCFLRKMNHDLHSDRSVEIPACGGFMLGERTSDHQRLFKEDQEAVFFSNHDELLGKTKYYLDHEEERKVIANAGRARCIHDDYTNVGRIKYMLNKIEELQR